MHRVIRRAMHRAIHRTIMRADKVTITRSSGRSTQRHISNITDHTIRTTRDTAAMQAARLHMPTTATRAMHIRLSPRLRHTARSMAMHPVATVNILAAMITADGTIAITAELTKKTMATTTDITDELTTASADQILDMRRTMLKSSPLSLGKWDSPDNKHSLA